MKTITEPSRMHHVPSSLAGRVSAIREILEHPNMYVENRANDEEFKTIIVGRVAAKIKELKNLSSLDKEKYITEQKKLKEIAARNQAMMTNRQPPAAGSEAHTLLNEEWLLQQHRLFYEESVNQWINNESQQDEILRDRIPFIPLAPDHLQNEINLPQHQIEERPTSTALAEEVSGCSGIGYSSHRFILNFAI